jgi:hypothetical protein
MDKDKVAIYSGGIYFGDKAKLVPLLRNERVLTNEDVANMHALIKESMKRLPNA